MGFDTFSTRAIALSGFGYLALLVALLVGLNAWMILPAAFFFNMNSMEFFRFVIQHFCPQPPNFGGLSDKISRSKSPIFGGFRGQLRFVTAARDFIELTLIQGTLVLFVLLGRGVSESRRQSAKSPTSYGHGTAVSLSIASNQSHLIHHLKRRSLES